MRIIHSFQDQTLAEEIALVRRQLQKDMARGVTPSHGMLMYQLGLRTAGILLDSPTCRRSKDGQRRGLWWPW